MSETTRITRDEIDRVSQRVVQIIADALDRDVGDIALGSRLVDDLEAESIDFLDILFRLERAFEVKLPQRKIMDDARGDIPEAEFEHGGVLSEVGVRRLQEYLDEVPVERFVSPLALADIPRLFTVETFCKLVVRSQRAKQA